jgi:hypothetical protein
LDRGQPEVASGGARFEAIHGQRNHVSFGQSRAAIRAEWSSMAKSVVSLGGSVGAKAVRDTAATGGRGAAMGYEVRPGWGGGLGAPVVGGWRGGERVGDSIRLAPRLPDTTGVGRTVAADGWGEGA